MCGTVALYVSDNFVSPELPLYGIAVAAWDGVLGGGNALRWSSEIARALYLYLYHSTAEAEAGHTGPRSAGPRAFAARRPPALGCV